MLIDAIFRSNSLENPAVPVTVEAAENDGIFNGDVIVNPRTAMKLAAVYACIRAAVTAELNSLMLRDGVPSGKVYLSRISEAISLATSEVAHQLRAPVADVALGATELPVVGAITWATYTEVSS